MKDLVMWVMLGCILIGTALFFIGRFIQKGTHLAEVFSGQEKSSPWGDRLFWIGAVLFRPATRPYNLISRCECERLPAGGVPGVPCFYSGVQS
jgi:hypothetical protein